MKYFAYLAPSCIEYARRHGVEGEVRRLAEKVELDQSISAWDKFLPSPYIKKSLGRDWRVVAERRPLPDQESVVICLIAVLSRGGREYSDFMASPTSFGAPLLPSENEIRRFVAERFIEPIAVLPPPSAVEYDYLYGQLNGIDTSYGIIYESKDWVKLIARADGQLAWYYDLVSQAISLDNADKTILRKHNLLILYRYFRDSGSIFLIAPLTDQDMKVRADIESRYESFLRRENASVDGPLVHSVDEMELLKNSGRAYPAFVTADSDIWLKIQKNTEANLALSPEESSILGSVTNADPSSGEGKIYPLFINGRPGSGKSTILQYLFADHLYSHLSKLDSERLPSSPLYLTYSEKLLQWAKTVVKSLILCNSTLLIRGSVFAEENLDAVVEECFAEFHRFLYGLLPDEDKKSFVAEMRIDFTEFRRRWHKKIKSNPDAELRSLSSELAWHVIRTYVKGMRDDENNYLDIDAYTELPNKQQTVGRETYRKIYDKVWEGWYKLLCEEEGYWDDQDLTRRLLDLEEIELSNHPVVFCDEAQDFTKIELEVILRLSLFSKRSLGHEDLKHVPFAFAGDPFQTLNPTGFDWGSVQAGFHEKIVQELDKSARSGLEFNYQELHFNYRSTKYIVGFCNLIQLLRGVLFGVKYLKPQRTWFEEDAPPPVYFDADHPSCQDKLRDQSEVVIILPCQEGEEKEYIDKDPFLSRLAEDEVRNFLSPMSAKGLEFSRVVLYKFGDDYCQNYTQLLKPLETGQSHRDNPEEGLPLEYFVNRLYVAASRPKRRLFIVDTKAGIDKFWNSEHLRNPTELLKKYPSTDLNGWMAEDLTFIQPGHDENWSEDRDNPFKLAKQFLEEGVATKDPYKLALAEANFRRAGRHHEEREARALRHEVEGDYFSAAKEHQGLGNTQKALRLFWKAKAYDEIFKDHSFANTIEHYASSFKLMPKSAVSCQNFLDLLHDEMIGASSAKIIVDKQWSEMGGVLLSALVSLREGDVNWGLIYNKIQLLVSQGLEFPRNTELAEVAFRANKYEDAIGIWDADSTGSHRSLSYKQAKAVTEGFPNSIKWLIELGEFERAVEMYNANSESGIPAEYLDSILDAHIRILRYKEAVAFLRRHPVEEPLEKLYLELRRAKVEELAVQCAGLLLISRLRAARWSKAVELIQRAKWSKDDEAMLQATLLNELATSELLIEESFENQNYVADYLKKHMGQFSANPSVTPQLIGAAVERVGRIIDALIYYESIWKSPKYEKSAEGDFARKRWVKCKYRQAEYSQKQGKEGDAYRQKREAERLAEQWKIQAEGLPIYPDTLAVSDARTADRYGHRADLSDEQVKAIKDLLNSNWKAPQIASVLGVALDDVERVRVVE